MKSFRSRWALLCALLFCALSLVVASPAQAQSSSDFVGRWTGTTDWDGTKYDSSDGWWDFNADGSFVDDGGEGGTWSLSGDTMRFQYSGANGGGHSVYSGRLIGGTFIGSMTNTEINGVFAFHRIAAATGPSPNVAHPSAAMAASIIGNWRFHFTDNTHEDWDFLPDGSATGPLGADGAPAERGTWRMSGSRVDITFAHVVSGAVASMSLTLRDGTLSGRYVSQTFQGDIVGQRQ